MTTTPNPTAAEHERAAAYAEHCAPCSLRHGPPIDDEGILALARCYLALKAQLAESERARAKLRAAMVEANNADRLRHVWSILGDALAADQATARESAENTAEETTVEHAEYCNLTCDEGGHHAGQCRYIPGPGNAKSQPPEPVEPSDAELATTYYDGARARVGSRGSDFHCGLLAVYRAGLAAEAAARSKALDYWKHQTKHNRAELERVRAELERERTVAIDLGIMSVERAKELERLRSQARARRVPTREALAEAIQQAITQRDQNDGDWFDKYLRAADAVLRLFAVAPPLLDHQLGIVIREATLTDPDCDWVAGARAAMTALGFQDSGGGGSADAAGNQAASAPSGSVGLASAQPSPPVTDNPRRTVLARDPNTGEYFEARFKRAAAPAVEERPWNYEAPPDSEIGEMHELKPSEYDIGIPASAEYRGLYDGCPSWGDEPGQFMMDADCSVAAWRPASAAPAKGEQCSVCGKPLELDRSMLPEEFRNGSGMHQACFLQRETDSAWLKRTVEELTTARPVEVTAGNDDGVWKVASPGQLTLFFGYSARERDTDGVWSNIAAANWPLRRNAKPAEPSPQPGGELDALTRRVERVEGLLQYVFPEHWARIEREERERGSAT